jgi:N-acetylglutamate synthase
VAERPATGRPGMVRGLQERAARAQPAEHVREADGWWLRHDPRGPWWMGTALPHGEATPGELVRRVATAEEFYAAHGAAAGFQVSPGACPAGLDAVLAGRGYRRRGPTSLQAAPTARVLARGPGGSPRVRLDDRPARAWLRIRDAVHGQGRGSRPERDMLDRLDRPCAYACAMIGDDVVAVGRAVADTGWAGVFGMATLPWARGKGAARAVLAALAGWAGAHGAGRMYLQVERDNIAALRLYERAGFRELCVYHYRIAG